MTFQPRGIRPGQTQKRFASTKPTSFDAASRTVQATISEGSPVQRFYGTEVLKIARSAVITDRIGTSGIPLLNSHQQVGIANALGKVTRTWIAGGALVGELQFNRTPEGEYAMGMVERGELRGISAGYRVLQWEVTDENGKVIDPEVNRINFDDELTFTATRWELLEASLVSVAADSAAVIRSFGSGNGIGAIRAAKTRLRMHLRAARMPVPSSLR